MNLHKIGDIGQEKTLNFYLKNGYKLICANFQFYKKHQQGRVSEVDLIVAKDFTIVFVEVKTRNSKIFGSIAGQITKSKISKLQLGASYFISLLNDESNFPLIIENFKKYNVNEEILLQLSKNKNEIRYRFDLACVQNGVISIVENFI